MMQHEQQFTVTDEACGTLFLSSCGMIGKNSLVDRNWKNWEKIAILLSTRYPQGCLAQDTNGAIRITVPTRILA